MAEPRAKTYKLRDLIAAGELGKMFDVSVETVLEWRRSGNLPGYRIGRRVFFLEAELMDWIREKLRIQG